MKYLVNFCHRTIQQKILEIFLMGRSTQESFARLFSCYPQHRPCLFRHKFDDLCYLDLC